jgi:uncharacterized membrane protein HdeD (DUF308 family)
MASNNSNKNMAPTNDTDYPAPEELAYVEDVVQSMAPYWYVYVLRGLVVTAFGLFFLFSPAQSMDVVAKVFGSLLIIEGGVNLIKVFIVCCCTDSRSMLFVYFVTFVTNTALGMAVISHPHETVDLLMIFAAVWFVCIGVLQLLLACVFRAAEVRGGADFAIGFTGLVYLILGIVFLANLTEGIRFTVRIIGVVVTIFGIQLLYLGMRLKGFNEDAARPSSAEYSAIQRNPNAVGSVSNVV